MAKLTREELKKLREKSKQEITEPAGDTQQIRIIVGLGTCGIAAGADETMQAFKDEILEQEIDNVVIKQTGCMGLCYAEPTVEVLVPGMPKIIYGKVDAEEARKIVRKHLLGKVLINDLIYDRPAVDIIEGSE